MNPRLATISDKAMACRGALVAVAATFDYSIVVMVYVIIRSSLTIYSSMPAGERVTILWINGFSVAYSVAIFSILMTMISSVTGAIAVVILKKSLLRFNPQFQSGRAVVISFLIAWALLTTQYLLLHPLLNDYMTFNYPEAFLFWWVFPAVIFLAVTVVSGWQFNNALRCDHPVQNDLETQSI